MRPFSELFQEPTRNGLTRPKAVRGAGVKMVNMGELFEHPRLRNAPMDRVPLNFDKESQFLLKPGDLLFARQSLVLEGAGKCSIFIDDAEPTTFESHIIRVRLDPIKADPLFYFYYLQSQHGRAAILSIVEQGAGASGIRSKDLGRLQIHWFPIHEQKRIAHILGTLDDKIELNRHMNITLEAMARALFKSWFIVFDPVRAKQQGRHPPGMDPATAELFPSEFEESELGPIPKGWIIEPLGKHISADRGLSYKGSGLREDGSGQPLYNLNSIYEGGGYKAGGIKYYDGDYRDKHVTYPGELIVTNTEQGHGHRLIGFAALVPKSNGESGLFSHHIYRVRPRSASPLDAHFLLHWFNNPKWHQLIAGYSNGTSINMLPLDALQKPNIAVPPKELIQKFSAYASAACSCIESNVAESRTLEELRDTLLPKLLSGELAHLDFEKNDSRKPTHFAGVPK